MFAFPSVVSIFWLGIYHCHFTCTPDKMASFKEDDDCVNHVHGEYLLEEDDVENQSGDVMPEILRQLTPEEYKKVGDKATLKMDIIIQPCLMLMYILNYLDRNNIASAKLANIEEDLNMTPTEYQSCISILFAGYSECSNLCPL